MAPSGSLSRCSLTRHRQGPIFQETRERVGVDRLRISDVHFYVAMFCCYYYTVFPWSVVTNISGVGQKRHLIRPAYYLTVYHT